MKPGPTTNGKETLGQKVPKLDCPLGLTGQLLKAQVPRLYPRPPDSEPQGGTQASGLLSFPGSPTYS
jgi:hypothetical protein